MRIGIAGAGIGGLAAAGFLARDGHDVTLFDPFARPKPVGRMLSLLPAETLPSSPNRRLAAIFHSLPVAQHPLWRARRWHLRAYQGMSAAFTPQYQSDSRVLPMIRDHALAPLARSWPVARVLTRLVCGDLLPPMPALTQRRG